MISVKPYIFRHWNAILREYHPPNTLIQVLIALYLLSLKYYNIKIVEPIYAVTPKLRIYNTDPLQAQARSSSYCA